MVTTFWVDITLPARPVALAAPKGKAFFPHANVLKGKKMYGDIRPTGLTHIPTAPLGCEWGDGTWRHLDPVPALEPRF